ncbi:alpha/beta hydrolase-fold protein [Flagellimonas sp.]|uniref:alpha/beta hydrolase-fold protein n=1 Tax=Flagellimonas sp. TaxID=2058762 RepID=UPI003B51FDAB
MLRIKLILFSIFSVFVSFGQAIDSKSTEELYSQILQENRTLQIATPNSYAISNSAYPVLFVLDSEYIFEYAKGSVDFLSNNFGFHPEVIVVGIPNTDRNRDLYVTLQPEGSYLKFIQFLEEELLPYIQNNYRTNGFKLLFGWSSGAGLANYVMVKKPKAFDAYILAGAGIGPNTAAFIKQELDSNAYKNTFFFASAEGSTPRADGLKTHQQLIEEINPKGLDWKFKTYPSANHVEAMSKGLYDGLKFVFRHYHIPDSLVSLGSQKILDYYQDLQSKYGFKTQIPIGAINEISGILMHQEQSEEAQKLLDHGLSLYPKSHMLWAVKAEMYLGLNQTEKAIQNYRMALKKATDKHAKNKYQVLLKGLAEEQEK